MPTPSETRPGFFKTHDAISDYHPFGSYPDGPDGTGPLQRGPAGSAPVQVGVARASTMPGSKAAEQYKYSTGNLTPFRSESTSSGEYAPATPAPGETVTESGAITSPSPQSAMAVYQQIKNGVDRSKRRTSVNDEALEGALHENWKTCRCDNCRAHRINGKTQDAHMSFLKKLNQANRRAHGIA